ncbi:hypothetical protein [Nocardia sp. NBC_01009]|uniref:hypothetical protein n=1 Tax=Nocardia sp. NBC_01009 TaxID=2975996 RepID=UPI00386BE8C2|nr:hypothetical protein OHA42_29275 [Nocardia sp. NBC_01009]
MLFVANAAFHLGAAALVAAAIGVLFPDRLETWVARGIIAGTILVQRLFYDFS